jgi:small subunit ribosomal protein S8e
MGIVKSNLHKRSASGAKRVPNRHKRKYELGRPSSNTRLGQPKIKSLRVRGGNYKQRALRLNIGNFAWGTENCARRTRILDVVYNATNNELVRTKSLVKGAIVQIDATPFRQFYEEFYNEALGNIKQAKLIDEKTVGSNKKHNLAGRRRNHEVEATLKNQFPAGKLLAILRSRPGQVGKADGYILEGPELAFYQKKILEKKKKK